MSSRISSWLVNVSLVVGSIAVGLGGSEVLLRATGIDRGRPRTPPIYQKNENPDISYELKPNIQESAFRSTVTTNSLGLRSPEPDPAKPSIALLGDSITFGYGLADDETIGARIGASVQEYNILNAAVPGYNLRQQAAAYREKLARFHPKILILVFYWNDLEDMTNAVLDDEGILRQPGWTPLAPTCNPIETGLLGWIPGRCWLDLHSATYRTIKKVGLARQERRNLEVQREEFRKNPEHESVSEDNLRRYNELFDSFAKDLPADQQKLFILWPDKELHAPTIPRLQAMAEAHGFRVVNLYDTFGNAAETLSWDTVHPSAGTVQKAAEVIIAALKAVPAEGDTSTDAR